MSRFSGPQGRGAMKKVRALKRTQAEERDGVLPADSQKRRRNRTPEARLIFEIFAGKD